MTGSIIVINVDIRETRVALVEGGVIAELQIERASHRGTVGNVVLGKVTRVLPGMQAAFIDVGQERSAFLHVEDSIRPDDFEHYLAGGEDEENESFRGPGGRKAAVTRDEADDEDEDDDEEGPVLINGVADSRGPESAGPDSRGTAHVEVHARGLDALVPEDEEDADELEAAHADEAADLDEVSDDGVDDDAVDLEAEDADVADLDAEDADEDEDEDEDETPVVAFAGDDDEDDDDEPLVAATETVTAVSVSVSEVSFGTEREVVVTGVERTRTRPELVDVVAVEPQPAGRGGRDRGRSGGRDGGRAAEPQPAQQQQEGRGGRRRGRGPQGRGRRGRQRVEPGAEAKLVRGRRATRGGKPSGGRAEASVPPRVTRSVPIREVVNEGQEVIVQVSKEPIGTKGARVTSHVSLPGRYVVYLPTVDHIGISKRIGSDKERARLREAIEAMKPPTGGLIVRTVAEGLTKKQLKADVGYLVRLWGEIAKKRERRARAGAALRASSISCSRPRATSSPTTSRRSSSTTSEQYERLRRFVEMFMPERVKDVELYDGRRADLRRVRHRGRDRPRARRARCRCRRGGYLIIDQAEALTAIDVNTGRFVGKGSKDLEETILKTNLEAVKEIAYQLRFRNIGGLIILDLIDMERATNREKVRAHARGAPRSKDKAKTTLNRISELGLIEMTRKRTRESLGRTAARAVLLLRRHRPAPVEGRRSPTRSCARSAASARTCPATSVVVNAHPAVVDLLKSDERAAVHEAENRFMRQIELVPRKEYHLEQFDLQGR